MNDWNVDTGNILRHFDSQLKTFSDVLINCHQIFLKYSCICFLKMLSPSKAKNSRLS